MSDSYEKGVAAGLEMFKKAALSNLHMMGLNCTLYGINASDIRNIYGRLKNERIESETKGNSRQTQSQSNQYDR